VVLFEAVALIEDEHNVDAKTTWKLARFGRDSRGEHTLARLRDDPEVRILKNHLFRL
jgi:hypothetical protein